MKKKYILIIVCIIIAILLGIGVVFVVNKDDVVNDASNENVKEESKVDTEEESSNLSDDKIVILDEYNFELGDDLPTIDEFVNNVDANATIKIFYDDEEVKGKLDKVGDYSLFIYVNGEEYTSNIVVKDTTVPVVTLNEVTIKSGESYDIKKFIKSVVDYSEYEVSFVDSKMSSYKNAGSYEIKIKVVDKYGNETISNTTLKIEKKKTTSTTNNNSSNKTSSNNENKKPGTNNGSIQSGSNTGANNNSSNNSSNNSNNSSSNNSSSGSSSNNGDSSSNEKEEEVEEEPEKVVVVSTESKEDVVKEDKYGAIVEVTEKYTLITYSDGSTKKENSRLSYKLLDYSKIRTSSSEMMPEAKTLSANALSKRQDMLSYINEYRSEVGVSALTLDETLSVAATIRGMELAYTNVEYGHNRPNGSSYATVITEVYGYPSFYGENLAGGTSYSTAKAASEGLKSSSGHYANMINKNFTKVGIGYVYVPFGYRYYWVQLFVA